MPRKPARKTKIPKAPPPPPRDMTKRRPELDDQETRQELINALYLGETRTAACDAAGISIDALERYEKRPENAEFADLVKKSKVKRRMRLKAIIEQAAKGTPNRPGQWQAAAWLAERENPELLGRRVIFGAKGDGDVPVDRETALVLAQLFLSRAKEKAAPE